MIKLTKTTSGEIYINPNHVEAIYEFDGNTLVRFSHGKWTVEVQETPQDIMHLIAKAKMG